MSHMIQKCHALYCVWNQYDVFILLARCHYYLGVMYRNYVDGLVLWNSMPKCYAWFIYCCTEPTIYRLSCVSMDPILYPPHNEVVGGSIGFTPSVRPSVCPSVRPASRVRSVAPTVQDGFFPYLVQMINSMRGCVACDDPWAWPISSGSFGLDL